MSVHRLPCVTNPESSYVTPEKAKLLAHYATREPKHFVQVDSFSPASGTFHMGDTTELMLGSAVRILIDPATNYAEAAVFLKQAAILLRQIDADRMVDAGDDESFIPF